MIKTLKLVVKNEIEDLTVELYTNGDKRTYQTMKISNEGASKTTNMIAPIDFYSFINGILYSESIKEFEASIQDTWASELVSSMIDDLFDLKHGVI